MIKRRICDVRYTSPNSLHEDLKSAILNIVMQAEGSKKRFIWLTVIGILLNVAAIGYLRYQVTLPNLLHLPTSSQIRADMMSSCGLINPAFCDSFSIPHPGGRGGDLDDSKWSFFRDVQSDNPSQGAYNEFVQTDEMFCKTPISGVLPDLDSFFCNNNGQEEMHWMTAFNDNGQYGYIGARIRQPFDFANRTGTIAFSVDAVTRGSHSWWPEVVITDTPVMGPHHPSPDENGTPQNGVDIQLNGQCNEPNGTTDAPATEVGDVQVTTNYVTTSVQSTDPKPWDTANACVKTMRDNHNMFQIKISQNQIQIYGSDYNSTTLKLIGTYPVNLNFTRGYVNFEQAQYNAQKFNGQKTMTYHWHDIGFDGPVLPTPRSYEVANPLELAGHQQDTPEAVNTGFTVSGTDGSMWTCCTNPYGGSPNKVSPLTLSNVDLTNAQSAMLEFNVNGLSGGQSFKFQVNGNQWHTVVHPSTANSNDGVNGGGWFGYAIPVPLNELQDGTNTVDFTTDGTNNYEVANIDLELSGDNITATPEAVINVPPVADMHVIPSHTDEHSSLIYGTATPISVTMHAEDLSADIAKAAATVTLSSRLKVQSVTPGDCGMNFDKTPTTSDLSFSGTIPNTTTTACTVFTAMVMPTAVGNETAAIGYAQLSNASITSTAGQEILGQTFDGTYQLQSIQDPPVSFYAPSDTTYRVGDTVNFTPAINNGTDATVNTIVTYTLYDSNENVVSNVQMPETIPVGYYGQNLGSYKIPASAPYGEYTIGATVTSTDGKTVYYQSNDAGNFAVLPSISETMSLSPTVSATQGKITMTTNMTAAGSLVGYIKLLITDPNHVVHSQIIDDSQMQFMPNIAMAHTFAYTLPPSAPTGNYTVAAYLLSPDKSIQYYANTTAGSFTLAANALSVDNLQDTYNATVSYTGTRLSNYTTIKLKDANGNDLSSSVTYPDAGHFQFTLTLNDYNTHSYTLTGYDANNNASPPYQFTVTRHMPGNIVGTGKVDLGDLSILAKDWHRGKAYGDILYNPMSDMNGDGNVDIYDLSELAKYWGQ